MSLSAKQVEQIVSRYAKGEGETIADIARSFDQTPAAIRYHLKKLGELSTDRQEAPMTDSAQQSDEDLGIGEEADDGVSELAALLANPLLKKLVDAAVAERLGALSAPAPQQTAAIDASAFGDLAATLKHMVQINAQQQPGYQKPLPVEEVDRRAAGAVEMWALLAQYERDNTPPCWVVGESGFFECSNALEFAEGEKIRTYLPPVEDFTPDNEQARKVHAALIQMIGGRTPEIGEQVKQAQLASKLPPLVSGAMQPTRQTGPVERVEAAPERPVRQRRTMGTIVAERKEVIPGARDGAAVGPAFSDAA